MKLWTLLLVVFVPTGALAADRPNIVFLFADDQRADTIQAWGNPHIKTPHLDRLSREGFSFRNNYCAGSYSGAVCVASRSMLMTGRHWMRIDDRKDWTGLRTLPELLIENGYKTLITGKWHNGRRSLARSFQTGRAVFLGGMSDHTKVPLHDLTSRDEFINMRVGDGFSSRLFADAAISFLAEQSDDQPFFLYVSFTAPHDPRQPPLPYRRYYYDHRPPLPENFLPQHPFDNGHVSGRGRDESLAPWPRERGVISDQLCEYYGLITHLDEQVGRILDTVDRSPFADNTIVIYTADHGLAMGSHGLLGKQNVYEHSMKSPLVVRGRGIPAGRSTQALTYIHDLFRTICSAAGSAVPEGTDGHDLSALWSGEKEHVRESVFLPFRDMMRAVRSGRWKLHVYPRINHTLLFDLQSDPGETRNLADAPRHADTVATLTDIMQQWQRRVGDQQPLRVVDPQPKQIDLTGGIQYLDRWQPEWIRKKYFSGDHVQQRR